MASEADGAIPTGRCGTKAGRLGPWMMVKLLLGRPRRLFYNLFRKGYVQANRERRRGACNRCGACCQLAVRCRHLYYDEHGLSACKVYDRRLSPNCLTYPIDQRDLADRDVMMPEQPCGFRFVEDGGGRADDKIDAVKRPEAG